jgi:cytochrome P450 family 307 subfamily A
LYQGHMKKLQHWAHSIRQFILRRVIEQHRERLQKGGTATDFTDALLLHLESDPELTWEHAIYELEDFLGGHSAVGNLIMLTLAVVVMYPQVSTSSIIQKAKSKKQTR